MKQSTQADLIGPSYCRATTGDRGQTSVNADDVMLKSLGLKGVGTPPSHLQSTLDSLETRRTIPEDKKDPGMVTV